MTSVKLINHSSSTADWNYLFYFVFVKSHYKTRQFEMLYLGWNFNHTFSAYYECITLFYDQF